MVDDTPLIPSRKKIELSKSRLELSLKFLVLTASLCISGAANDVLSKVVSNTYTQRFAFFVDQGNNIVYALFSFVPVFFTWLRNGIPEGTRQCPQWKFAFMGLLDALGTYFSSVGAVHTPGQLQTVLGQALIPISMVASAVFLGSRYTWQEVASASVVVLGACVVVGPVMFGGSVMNGSNVWPPAIVVYAASNIPMALSNVYKELGFVDMELDVLYLTFVVVVYQTALSFGLLALQTIPYLSGSAQGISLSAAWANFVGGSECFFGFTPENADDEIDCTWAGALLVAYVAVNLGFNMIGLLLVKAGSELRIGSVLCSLAFAVKLPVSTWLFSIPLFMGAGAEPMEASTWGGLVLVIFGFLWHVRAGQGQSGNSDEDVPLEQPWAFHERVVGCVSTAAVRPPSPSRSRSPARH